MANWEAKVGRATGQAMRSSAAPNSAPKHSSAPHPPPQIPPFRTPTLLVSSSSSFTSRPKLKPEEEEVCKTESKGEALQQRYGTYGRSWRGSMGAAWSTSLGRTPVDGRRRRCSTGTRSCRSPNQPLAPWQDFSACRQTGSCWPMQHVALRALCGHTRVCWCPPARGV